MGLDHFCPCDFGLDLKIFKKNTLNLKIKYLKHPKI